MLKPAKLSISVDGETNEILTAVDSRWNCGNSQMIQRIVKEWAADRGIRVEVVINVQGLLDET